MTADESGSRGLVFFSHASEDKDYVDEVRRYCKERSHIFYDIVSMRPGEATVSEMERGVAESIVFVMFVSPNVKDKEWVQYEGALAKVENIRRRTFRVIAVPIKGASYRDAPSWMQRYFATNEHYTPRDVARLIQSLFEQALRANGDLSEKLFYGRQEIESSIIRELRTRPTKTGIPINVVHLFGIPGMGRLTLAEQLIPKAFPGLRLEYPVFSLARQGNAKDLFLALRSEIEGEMSEERLNDLLKEWPAEDVTQMAPILAANLQHFSKLNQVVIIKSSRAIRDFSDKSPAKPWVEALFNELLKMPQLKILWVSDIGLEVGGLGRYPNVIQFHVTEVTSDAIYAILSDLIGPSRAAHLPITEVAEKINGHPATAHHVAEVARLEQKGLEAIIADGKFVVSYQQQFVEEILERKNLSENRFAVLQLLSVLPSLDFGAIADVVGASREAVSKELDGLVEAGLVTYSMSTHYKIPELVRSVFFIKHPELNRDLLGKVATLLAKRVASGRLTIESVNALIFSNVLLGEKIPDALRDVITPALVHDLVYEQFQLGMRFDREYRTRFESAAKLAELVNVIPMDNDAFETVLYYGAESLIRLKQDPTHLIEKLDSRGLAAAYFLRGSDAYHRTRNDDEALKNLKIALKKRAFIFRTATMLSKLHFNRGEAAEALRIFEEEIGLDRVRKDSGMLVQMIRCLKVAGRGKEAEVLAKDLARLTSDDGDFEMYQAARELRARNFERALFWVAKAKTKSRVDRVNLTMLEAVIQIDSGNVSKVGEAITLARGVGRENDALHLSARVALRGKDGWREAEPLLRRIVKPNFYDKALLLAALQKKSEDTSIVADPVASKALRLEIDALTLETRATTDDFDR